MAVNGSPRITYVLSFDAHRVHEYLMILSVASLKVFHPGLEIVCLADDATKRALQSSASLLLGLVDTWIICDDVTGDPRLRSRMMKTSARRRIGGNYLFLDTDTVVVRNLNELLSTAAKVAMVQDQFPGHAYFGFPEWLERHYQVLGWTYPTQKYFNSGVMVVEDCEQTQDLYAEWEKNWKSTCELGLRRDQPALNHSIEKTGIKVSELPMRYNAMVQVDERYRSNACILHLFNSIEKRDNLIPTRFMSEYQRLIDRLSAGYPVTGKEVVTRILARKALSRTMSWRRQYQAGNLLGALELLFRRAISKLSNQVFGRLRINALW